MILSFEFVFEKKILYRKVRKKCAFMWEPGKEIEKVKEFKYLGYMLRSNNSAKIE